ncbi:hypothetical protein J2S09_004974 [Bacillus fengqiuensis]|nr:hypothetical protein [Bacillus fengqiuensis]
MNMKMFMNTLEKNISCMFEAMYLYTLFFLVELQTTTGNFLKTK